MIKTIRIAAGGFVCTKLNLPPGFSLSRVLRFALKRTAWPLAGYNCIGVFVLLLAISPDLSVAATKGTVPPARDWQSTGEHTIFQVNDHEVLNPVKSGRWRLSGVLEVQFAGRIEPHENSVFQLFGPGVTALEGLFASVVLPKGWR